MVTNPLSHSLAAHGASSTQAHTTSVAARTTEASRCTRAAATAVRAVGLAAIFFAVNNRKSNKTTTTNK